MSKLPSISRRLTLLALSLAAVAAWSPGANAGGKPEDVFKGQIIITGKRLPTRFSSQGAFVDAVRKAKTDKIWPKEQEGNDHAVWEVEYIAFFAQPLNDNEINVKFFDITDGGSRFVAGDEQYTRTRGERVFASNIQLAKPNFDVNRKYMMTIETNGRRIAITSFWLRGKGPNYSGKVEFSDDDAKGK
jgi:hypothetical protein